jgi:hypothetical protein
VSIWLWHAGRNCLVTPTQSADGKVDFLAFPAPFLRAAGWRVDEDGFRRSLPRFDGGPQLATSAKDSDIKAAAALASTQRALGERMRRGA